jgi:hypothetical protein
MGLLSLLVASSFGWAQASKSEVFRKEAPTLQRAADQAIGEVMGISLLQSAKATYLEEYGVVISLEVALEPPRNPFESATQGRSQVADKQRQVRDKIKNFLTQRAAGVQTADGIQFVTVVVHLFNSNPVDSPNLPRQLIFTVKKQDPSNVTIREL